MRRTGFMLMGIVAAVTLGLDFVAPHHGHAVFWWHSLPGFDLLYGFVGAVGLVLFAKWVGHAWLERPEDYYGDDTP